MHASLRKWIALADAVAHDGGLAIEPPQQVFANTVLQVKRGAGEVFHDLLAFELPGSRPGRSSIDDVHAATM